MRHLLLTLLLCALPSVVRPQSIIAVDFGIDFMKVVLVQPGKSFDVALSPDSKRKSFTGLAIADGVRSYGSESFNSYGKRPASALWQARNLLGQAPAHLSAAHLRAHLIDYHDISVADDGTGAIRIEFAKGTKDARTFMPEKVVAMILGHARDMGERHGNTKVSSVVITVPSFFTQSQRQAIMDAAEIAGLQVLALADENAAAAVQYAVDRTFTEDAKNVLFFNMGSGSTQVSVVSFTGGKERLSQKDQRFVRVLSKAWDHTLGASEFDVKLMDFFADDFDKVHPGKESIRTAPRAMVRLKKEGRAVKEILSGLDKFPVSFQSLYRDVDYKQVVTRALFEELSAPLLARIRAPIERALLDAGVLASSLSGIEIVGGGVRIPCVKTEMRKALPGDLEFSTHLNGDEGMALGAAFIGANVSKTFRVPRVVVLQDANPREVRLQLAGESGTGEKLQRDTVLFPRLAPVDAREPTTHTVKFAWKADFAVTLSAVDDGVVAAYQVSWLDPAAQQLLKPAFGEPKVFLGLSMDRNLMAALDGAEVRVEETYEDTVPVKANSTANATAAADAAAGNETTTEVVTRTRVHRFPLKVERTDQGVAVRRLTAESKKQAQALLKSWDQSDRSRAKREEARNALEAYSFVAKDKLSSHADQVSRVISPPELEALNQDLAEVEDWMYEHKDADVDQFDVKRAGLQARVDKVFRLIREQAERPSAVAAFVSALDAVEARRGNWTAERPWVEEKRIQQVMDTVAHARKWLDVKREEQAKLSPMEEPVLTVLALQAELEKVQRQVELLLRIKKPFKLSEDKPAAAGGKKPRASRGEDKQQQQAGEEEQAEQQQQAGEEDAAAAAKEETTKEEDAQADNGKQDNEEL